MIFVVKNSLMFVVVVDVIIVCNVPLLLLKNLIKVRPTYGPVISNLFTFSFCFHATKIIIIMLMI